MLVPVATDLTRVPSLQAELLCDRVAGQRLVSTAAAPGPPGRPQAGKAPVPSKPSSGGKPSAPAAATVAPPRAAKKKVKKLVDINGERHGEHGDGEPRE